MKKGFEKFLISQGYKEYTPSGKHSTVYDYVKRIDTVCKWENTDWSGLAEKIASILPEYEKDGAKENLGAKSHNAVRCALRCYKKYISTI